MAINPIVVGDIMQAIIRGRVNGQVNLNVLHYRCTKSPTGTNYFIQTENLGRIIGGPAADSIVSTWLPNIGKNATIDWVQTQRVSPIRSIYTRFPVGAPGTNAADCEAQNTAAVLTKQVDRVGRGRVGSFHAGYVPPAFQLRGLLTVAGTVEYTKLADKLNALLVGPLDGAEYEPVTFEPTAPVGFNFSKIVNVFVQPEVRVMRRRTVGLGI